MPTWPCSPPPFWVAMLPAALVNSFVSKFKSSSDGCPFRCRRSLPIQFPRIAASFMVGSAALAGRSFLNVSSRSQRLCFPIKCMFELPCPDLTRSFRQLIFPWRIALCYVVVCVVLSYSSLDFIFVCGFTHLCHQMFFLAQPQRFLVGSIVTALSPLCSVPSLDSCCVVLVVRDSNSDVVFWFRKISTWS